LSAREPARRRVHDPKLGDGGVAEALDLRQSRKRRRDRFGERTELRDQLLRQRLDVALRDGAEQHQFEQFVIADGLGASLTKPFAQPLAVAMIMRRRL
jgi:hypothetical protein